MNFCLHRICLNKLFKVQNSINYVRARKLCLECKKLSDKVEKLKSFDEFDKSLVSFSENFSSTFLPRKSTSLAYFINSSKSLQSLLNFGVQLYKIEKTNPEAIDFLAKLDFLTEIRPKLIFLNDLGITPNEFGEVLTKNPEILHSNYSTEKLKEVLVIISLKTIFTF